MERTLAGLIEEVRRLPAWQQLTLIEHLARELQKDLEAARAVSEEFAAWDAMSDEALANFEKTL